MAAPRSALLVSHCFVLDSRNIMPGSFFVPLKGETQDGHAYIPEALEKGATGVFINEEEYAKKPDFYRDLQKKYPKAQFIPVKNTLYAFQDAARARTEQFPALIKIAITGSSGKTTTKEIAAVVFSQKYNVIATQGNLNTETGLPLSVLKIRGEHQAGIFELGMNRRG
ncbi:MAG: Mur ligase domain-containing protein, partial [Treponema sp.]|nr:Mur ligase domain-containing protein [Treponema sp.]